MTKAVMTPESMAEWWNSEPTSVVRGTADGFAACEWRIAWPRPQEIFAEPDPSTHLVSVHLSGSARTDHRHDGRRVFQGEIMPDTVNIIPAGIRPHALIQSNELSFFHLFISDRRLRRSAEDNGLEGRDLEVFATDYKGDLSIASLCRSLAEESRHGPPSRLFIDSIANIMTTHLLRGHTSLSRSPRRGYRKGALADWQTRRIIERLSDQIDQNVGLDELAELVGLSPTYLCSAFRRTTGVPPHQWQKQLRLERAKVMLEQSNLTVTEIALEIGYANPGHFATVFKDSTGVSPRQWRRQRLA